jgi:nucleoside-diphosphate-sugar epimerase
VRVLVTGATGTVGPEVVRQFVERGHEVAGMTRTPSKGRAIEALAAEAVVADLRRGETLRRAVDGRDVVVHLATASALVRNRRRTRDVNVDGARRLAAACRDAGVAFLVYANGLGGAFRHVDGWIDEDTPPKPAAAFVAQRFEAEALLRTAGREEGFGVAVVRLPHLVYGPRGVFLEQFVERLRRGTFRVIGDGAYRWSLVHGEDAAQAFVLAAERRPRDEVFHIADDEPVPFRDFVAFLAARLGRRPPGRVPPALAALALGRDVPLMLTDSLRIRTTKAKERLGWRPRWPTWREGVPAALRDAGVVPP